MKYLALTLFTCLLALNVPPRLYDSNFKSLWDTRYFDQFNPDLKITVPIRRHRLQTFPKQCIYYKMGAKFLSGDVAVYVIYYGEWNQSQKHLLNEFTGSLGDSTWWSIMRKYYYQQNLSTKKVYVTGKLSFGGSVDDNYSLGRILSGEAKRLPADSAGIYLILTAGDVEEHVRLDQGKMCADYCGYHLNGNLTDGSVFYYAMAGRPSTCMSACVGSNINFSPNGDPATDAMVSTIAHELAEAVSDPDDLIMGTRAWNANDGQENGDMCSYKFGHTDQVGARISRSLYNYVSSAGRKFLVQQNWDPELQMCVSSA